MSELKLSIFLKMMFRFFLFLSIVCKVTHCANSESKAEYRQPTSDAAFEQSSRSNNNNINDKQSGSTNGDINVSRLLEDDKGISLSEYYKNPSLFPPWENGNVRWHDAPAFPGIDAVCWKVTTVFGAPVCVTKEAWETSPEKCNHVVQVYYQLLDNNADGILDDRRVVQELVANNYVLFVPATEEEAQLENSLQELTSMKESQMVRIFEATINSCDASFKANKILFLGDSMAEFMGESLLEEICGDSTVVNAGIGGTTAQQWAEYDVDDYRSQEWDAVYISVGGNDFLGSGCFLGTDVLKSRIEAAIENIVWEIAPGASSYVVTGYCMPKAPLPIPGDVCSKPSDILPLQQALAALSPNLPEESKDKLTVIDSLEFCGGSVSSFSDPKFFMDTIHLNPRGYCEVFSQPSIQQSLLCDPNNKVDCDSLSANYSDMWWLEDGKDCDPNPDATIGKILDLIIKAAAKAYPSREPRLPEVMPDGKYATNPLPMRCAERNDNFNITTKARTMRYNCKKLRRKTRESKGRLRRLCRQYGIIKRKCPNTCQLNACKQE